jgi:hypothetical protein
MAAPERFADKVRFLLHRGHRPYMALSVISLPRGNSVASGLKRTLGRILSVHGLSARPRLCRASPRDTDGRGRRRPQEVRPAEATEEFIADLSV